MRGLLVLAVALVVSLATVARPAPASASVPTAEQSFTIDSNIGEISDWVFRGSPYQDVPPADMPAEGNVTSDLWLSEHRPMPDQTDSRAMWRELQTQIADTREAATGFSLAKTFLGRTFAVAGAAQVGWWIGTKARPLFYGIDTPGPTNVTTPIGNVEGWRFVKQGDTILSVDIGSAVTGTGREYVAKKTAPSDGLVADFTGPSPYGYLDAGDCQGTGSAPNLPELPNMLNPEGDTPAGGGFLHLDAPEVVTCFPDGVHRVDVQATRRSLTYFTPLQPLPPTPNTPPATVTQENTPKTQTAPVPATQPTPFTTIEDGTKTHLHTPKPGKSVTVIDPWIDSTAGGVSPDPVDNPSTVPQPGTEPEPEPAPGSSPDDPTYVEPVDDGDPGLFTPPAVPAIDMSPLKVSLGDKFPFGIFSWTSSAFGGFAGGGQAPRFDIPMPGAIDDLVIDMAPICDPIMDILRPVILVCALVGMVWLLCASALGIGSPKGED